MPRNSEESAWGGDEGPAVRRTRVMHALQGVNVPRRTPLRPIDRVRGFEASESRVLAPGANGAMMWSLDPATVGGFHLTQGKSMRLAVIGAGNVGGTLGRRWAAAGHQVVFGVRQPELGADAVKGGGALPPSASVATQADATRGADVLLLATPWAVVGHALRAAGNDSGALDGRILIDATNPVAAGLRVDAGPNGESGAERVQAMARKARVVKAFNTTGWENMRDPGYPGGAATMFFAGDDADAKSVVRGLATDLGFDPVDAGPLARARELEHLAVLWISLAVGGGVPPVGRDIAFRLMRR